MYIVYVYIYVRNDVSKLVLRLLNYNIVKVSEFIYKIGEKESYFFPLYVI